jgi:hypothetical protein
MYWELIAVGFNRRIKGATLFLDLAAFLIVILKCLVL